MKALDLLSAEDKACYKTVNDIAAIDYLRLMRTNSFILRPSSKGENFIAVTVKVDDSGKCVKYLFEATEQGMQIVGDFNRVTRNQSITDYMTPLGYSPVLPVESSLNEAWHGLSTEEMYHYLDPSLHGAKWMPGVTVSGPDFVAHLKKHADAFPVNTYFIIPTMYQFMLGIAKKSNGDIMTFSVMAESYDEKFRPKPALTITHMNGNEVDIKVAPGGLHAKIQEMLNPPQQIQQAGVNAMSSHDETKEGEASQNTVKAIAFAQPSSSVVPVPPMFVQPKQMLEMIQESEPENDEQPGAANTRSI